MIGSSLRASRQTLARAVLRQNTVSLRRTFITPTAVRQADLVQDLYLSQLKAYKAPAVKASDSEGHVLKFSTPKAPKSPEETDLQSGLKDYETSVPEVEGAAGAPGAAPVEQDWFEEELEEEASASHH